MTEHLLTPSKITAWLDCAHYLTLKHQVEAGVMAAPAVAFGSMARLLADKGLAHETDCLAAYERAGRAVFRVPERDRGESFRAWTARVGNPPADGHDVLYQMPLAHDGVRGIADFLVRTRDPATGASWYEPVDAKLARAEAKVGHVLQLCFYADALQSLTGTAPRHLHLWLGSGRVQTLPAEQYRPYWRRLRARLGALLDAETAPEPTEPEPCEHCAFCEFASACTATWRERDSLIYVAGLRAAERPALQAAGVPTLGALAERVAPVEGLRPERLVTLSRQAALQARARGSPERPPPFELRAGTDGTDTPEQGLPALPEPDDGDVFLDFEGHPFWRADAGLFFLLGLIEREPDGSWGYRGFWAHDLDEEATAARELIDHLAARRAAHPGMHVYHYNHTERSALERLVVDHGIDEVALAALVDTGLFVDLYPVARHAVQAGVESYGLKHLELLTGYERGHDIDAGAGAVVEYEQFTRTGDRACLSRIAAYNEDDVRATRALRDWLVAQRPDDLDWRVAELSPPDEHPDLDARVQALHAFHPDSPQHLLGHVLGYWLREWRAYLGPRLARCDADPDAMLDDPSVLAGLRPVALIEQTGKNGRPRAPLMRFALPAQAGEEFSDSGDAVLFPTEGGVGFAQVHRLDPDAGELDLTWGTRAQELGEHPRVLTRHDYVHPNPKPAALDELAARLLDPAGPAPNPASVALLERAAPTFTAGHGPPGGRFGDEVTEMTGWAPHLHGSYVAIQGPPGTGKTYRGAHLARALILAGRRVGITAMSHHAITNLLAEVVGLFTAAGDLDRLVAVQRSPRPADLPAVVHASANPACAKPGVNLVAGTTWLFAGRDLRDAPVDVLIIDEAGQLALADALAASRSARNLILLGDPLQLPQVAQAAHPGGGGRSVLEHVLGEDVTMPAERGVFLAETRRMHPHVCEFVSAQIYQARLTSHPSCAVQTTEYGTGLRRLRAEHTGRSTEAAEEAEAVAREITRLMGTSWTDQHAAVAPLRAEDFMVVAPFNDQVDLIRERFDREQLTRGVPVGTVDRFQGRQAAVVFFTMTTSGYAQLTRGAEFLFSRNRLNVAISRARCLVYLVCTEELLNSRARDVEQMRLIATLCAFAEAAEVCG